MLLFLLKLRLAINNTEKTNHPTNQTQFGVVFNYVVATQKLPLFISSKSQKMLI